MSGIRITALVCTTAFDILEEPRGLADTIYWMVKSVPNSLPFKPQVNLIQIQIRFPLSNPLTVHTVFSK